MVVLFFLLLIGWLLVGYAMVANSRPVAMPRHLSEQHTISIGLLWLSQAMAWLYLAYDHTWWLWGAPVRWRASLSTALPYPNWARFTAVPYPVYPLSCCLLE